MAWWEVFDVTNWDERQPEQRGLRAKCWVSDPDGRVWLRKSMRGSRPSEAAIEAFTLELARRCGFEVAFGRAAEWSIGSGVARGFVSLKFHDDSEEQRTGAELVPGFDRDSKEARIAATLPRAYEILEVQNVGNDEKAQLLDRFTRMILFDAWIGNGDRHFGNWALLVRGFSADLVGRPGLARFAPMFDTAGCLGAELQDGHALLKTSAPDSAIEGYAAGCKSGYGDGVNRPGILQSDVLDIVRKRPEWRSAHEELCPRIVKLLKNDVDTLLGAVPDGWWSEPRRTFARRLLGARVKIIEGAAP